MKVLLLNGSPRKNGNTFMALEEVASVLNSHDVETEIMWIGNKPMQGCIACGFCKKEGICVFPDGVYGELREKLKTADGFIVGSPTYYAGPAGSLCALLDRLFYSSGQYLKGKPAAAVGIARRGGAVATVQRLNLYFEIISMPVVTSQYWNLAFGAAPGEVKEDGEGMQTMRTLGHNMAKMLLAMDSIKDKFKIKEEAFERTNFIR